MLSRHLQRAAWVIGAVMAAVLFFLGGAALRLLMGPVSLGPFAGAIEDALNRSISGAVVRFDQAVLEWSRTDGRVNLIILGTKVFDLNGRIIAQAPKADLDFDAARLAAGHLSLKRFSLIGVQLAGLRTPDGTFQLGFGTAEGEPNILDTIRNILESGPKGPGSLESFAIRNARLAFRDDPTHLFFVSPDTSFTLTRKGAALDATLDSAIELAGAPMRVSVRALLNEDGMPQSGHVAMQGLSLPALSGSSPVFAALKPYRLVGDGDADFTMGEGGVLKTTRFHVTGAGEADSAAASLTFHIGKFEAAGSYDAIKNQLTLDDVAIDSPEGSVKGKGAFHTGWRDGGLSRLAGQFDASRLALAVPAWFSGPVRFSQVSLRGDYDAAAKAISIARLKATGGNFDADFTGKIGLSEGQSPALALQGTFAALPIGDAIAHWPTKIATGARTWVAANIPEGNIGPLRLDLNFAPGALDQSPTPDDAINIYFPFNGVTAHYLDPMTPITNGVGEALVTGGTFHATVSLGSVGPIAITSGDILIPDFHGAPGHFRAHTDGKVSDVLALIDEQPLGYAKRFGIAPSAAGGRAATDLDFTIPLVRDVALADLGIGVQVNTTELALPIDAHRKLEHGAVSFAVTPKSLTSQGTGAINGVPMTFKWTEDFVATAMSTRIDVAGRLDAAARGKLGITDPSWFKGVTPVNLSLLGHRFHFTEGSIKADLSQASAAFPIANLEKKTGTAATAMAMLRFAPDGAISADNLIVTSDGLDVRGDVSLDANGSLVNASLSRVRSGDNDFAAMIRPLPGDGLDMRIQGKSLDATQVFGDASKPKPVAAEKESADADDGMQNPLNLNVDVERAVFRDGIAYRDVAFALAMGAHEKLSAFSLDAAVPTKGKIAGRLTVENGVRKLAIDADDAGTFIRTVTGFASVSGGTFAAKVSFPGDAPQPAAAKTPLPDYEGAITLSNFLVMNQPFFARFFAAGSLDGPLRLLQGQGISIDKLNAPFAARGKVVTIRDGRASGSSIGGTFEGMLDRGQDRLDLAGTLVPIYGLNSVLGAIPVLGDLLVSKQGEGVFGVTYAMRGKLQEPAVSFNPLSVLTPGILRRIFEYSLPKDQPPPQAAAEPPTPPPVASSAQPE